MFGRDHRVVWVRGLTRFALLHAVSLEAVATAADPSTVLDEDGNLLHMIADGDSR